MNHIPQNWDCIPLICINTDLSSFEDYQNIYYPDQRKIRSLMYNWWKNEHHNFSLEDFFTYGKPNDFQMIRQVNYKKTRSLNYN